MQEGRIEVTAGDWDAAGRVLWTIPGVKNIHREENYWVVTAEGDIRSDIARCFAENSIPLLHLRRREQSLDDIYSRYFQDGAGDTSASQGVRATV